MRARKTVVALGAWGSAVLAGAADPGAALPVGALAAVLLWIATVPRTSEGPTTAPEEIPPPSMGMPLRPDLGIDAAILNRIEYSRGLILEAASRGLLDDPTVDLLMGLLGERYAQAIASPVRVSPQVATSATSPLPEVRATLPPVPVVPGGTLTPGAISFQADPGTPPTMRPAAQPPTSGPSATRLFLRRLRELVASDVAVHGLAYLGVLLLFAGTLGFILVSFTSVRPGLRPLAEISMPAVLLGSAWFLRRRGAPVVATSLGVLGGLLLPVVLAASFVDGVPFPPELQGEALTLTLAAAMLGLGAAYAAYTRREPSASMRYLVAPMVWAACWSVGLLFAEDAAGAIDLRRWTSGQFALVTAGVAVTAWLSRFRPAHALARPSRTSAVIGLPIAYGLAIGLAAVQGWPSAAISVAGIAAFATLEALQTEKPSSARIAQLGVVAVTSASLVPALGAGVSGAVGAVAFIAMLERSIRRDEALPLIVIAAGGAGIGLASSLVGPGTGFIAWGIAASWAHLRRLLGSAALEPWITVAAAALPLPAAWSLLMLVHVGPGLVALGLVVLAIAGALRALRVGDAFLAIWVPAAAAAVVLGTSIAAVPGLDANTSTGPTWLAVAAAVSTLALAIAPGFATVRVWATGASLAWASWLGGEAAALPFNPRLVAWSVAGLAAVVIPSVLIRRRSIWDHVTALGTAIIVPGLVWADGDAHLAVLAAWCSACAVTAVAHELGEAPFVRLLTRVMAAAPRLARRVELLPAIALASSLPFLLVPTLERVGPLEGHRSWTGVVLAALAVAYAGLARLAARRAPSARCFAIAAFVLCLVAIAVAAPAAWPSIEAVASVIAVVVVLGGELRRPAMIWIAWVASGVLSVLLLSRAGFPTEKLPLVVIAWGAILMTGGLAVDDVRSGRRAAAEGLRRSWLVPPVALGALATPVGLALVVGSRPSQAGGWALVAAALYLVVALQLRAGSVTTVTWSLVTFGVAVLSPRSPMKDPWLFAPWIAGLVLAAAIVARRDRDARDPWLRWDLPLVVVSHGVALVALARSAAIDVMPPTWTAIGAICVVAAFLWRTSSYAAIGGVLLVGAAWAAGPGWLALALAATSVGTGVAAAKTRGNLRASLQVLSAAALAGAWGQLAVFAGWGAEREAVFTAVGSAILAVSAAALIRWMAASRDWAGFLGGLSVVATLVAVTIALGPDTDRADHLAAAIAAVDLGGFAVALALTARQMGVRWSRATAAGLGVVGSALAAYSGRVSETTEMIWATSTGLAATVGALALWRRRPDAAWLHALVVVAGGSSAIALIEATGTLPRRGPTEAVLVLAAVECAAAGIVFRRRGALALAPVPLCVAWLLFASDAWMGEMQVLTVPIGLAVLAVAGVARAAARETGRVTPVEVIALEYAGMGFVVVAGLVETIALSPVRGVAVIAGGAALAVWGALTRVRRRVAFGLGAATVAAIEIPAVALLPLAPRLSGPSLWIALAATGMVVLAVAAGLERGSAKVRAAIGRIAELTEGWE